MNNAATRIELTNGNIIDIKGDARVVKSHLEGDCLTMAAVSEEAAEEIAREAELWGAETYTSGIIVGVGG